MKKLFLFLFFTLLALILQFVIIGWVGRAVVDLFFILVILWSYFRGWKEGVFAGFFCGLVKDIFFFSLVGVNAFSLSLMGLLISEVKGRVYQQNIVFFTLLVGVSFLINSLILSVWLLVFHRFSLIYTFANSLYPSLFYTCGLCGGIFLVEEKLSRKSIPQS